VNPSTARGVRHKALALAVAGALSLTATACAGVQGTGANAGSENYPNKALQVIVPVAPGGSTDTLARALARGLESELGESVVVVNKPGAGGTIGLNEVRAAAPDGYTVTVVPTNTLTVRPLVITDASPLRVEDFSVVKSLATEDVVLYSYAGSPFSTAQDVLALANSGGTVRYSDSGAGTVTATAQRLFFELASVAATAVPFDGGNPAKTAVLGKQVELGGGHPGEIAAEVKAGTLVPLVVFGKQPSQWFPDVPTADSLGIALDFDQRRLFAAPSGLPADIRSKLEQAVTAVQGSPEYQQVMRDGYFATWEVSGDEAAAALTTIARDYRQQVDALGVDLGG
jgi:tripartite-type tricarboxylate transporter receptor subunit TctC